MRNAGAVEQRFDGRYQYGIIAPDKLTHVFIPFGRGASLCPGRDTSDERRALLRASRG
jgi:hypothetical protein